MSAMLALIAGQGALPGLVKTARPDAILCELEGFPAGLGPARTFRIERLGSFLSDLRALGVTEVCLAGRVGRVARVSMVVPVYRRPRHVCRAQSRQPPGTLVLRGARGRGQTGRWEAG